MPSASFLAPKNTPKDEGPGMLKATKDKILPTTITGSLPRPSWYTENLGLKTFIEAMVETRWPSI